MKKKTLSFIFIIFISIFLKSCIMMQIDDQNLIKPSFDFQKTYILKHIPLYFMDYYNVWKYEPFDVLEFTSVKELKKSKLFFARQQITLVGNNFFIEDNVNKKKYILKQEFFPEKKEDKLINYSIYQDEIIIGTINQLDKYNTLEFHFNYKNNTYIIKGQLNKIENNIHSFIFNIIEPNLEITLGSIFKKYLYLKNEYEIVINREQNIIEDPLFICFGVFVDQILKENGYQFVGSTPENNIKSYDKNKPYLKEEFTINNKDILITSENIENTKEIEELKNAKEGDIVTFNNIIFYPNSDKIKPESLPLINQIAVVLKERNDINIEIIGHTNNVNNPASELELSKKRAQTVQRYLMSQEISAKRMKAYGYGSLYTKSSTIEESNRKVEIKISKKN